jgi:hypothetical protein
VGKHNKRGANLGGSSSGTGGTKRGGSAHTAAESIDQGTLTCPRCDGSGGVGRPTLEADTDGAFAGEHDQKCPRCDGTGRVTAR